MSKEYITFDEYYDVEAYNSFLTAAKNNNIEFQEFLKIKPPYSRFLWIDSKNLPAFVNYDIAKSNDIKWLVSTVKPVYPNEAYALRRREGKDISYWNYILPEPLQDVHKKDYILLFKAWNETELLTISKKLGKVKIYKLGKAEQKGFNIYFCFNSYIKDVLPQDRILLEYNKNQMPKNPGELEYNLNHFILVKEKLMNKTFKLEYFYNGSVYPLKKDSFI